MQRLIQKTNPKRALINGAMKTIHLTLVALLFTLSSQATVITVDNNPKSPADYSDLQTAVDSSNSGDTLYIQGSPTSYGSVSIDHQLTLIGAGYNPSNQWGLKSEVSQISLKKNTNTNTNANGTKIIGLYIDGGSGVVASGYGPQNIYVARCLIDVVYRAIRLRPAGGLFNGGSWLIENNIITGDINPATGTNITVTNNLIIDGIIEYSDKNSVMITNNTFHYTGASDSVIDNSNVTNLTFRNNLLINSTAGSSGCSGCTFENNITTENQDFVFGSCSGSNNMVNTNPDLVDTSNGPNNPFDNDYTPTSSSPAINAGTDGTDIGITGGSSPSTVSSTNMPAIPQVIEMNIYDMTIPQNDSLQIDIRARDQK